MLRFPTGWTTTAEVRLHLPAEVPLRGKRSHLRPHQYVLQDINLTSGQSSQINLQGSGSIGLNYHLGSDASVFEFGALIRNAHKGQDALSPTYHNFAANVTPPLMSQFTTKFTNPTFYGGS